MSDYTSNISLADAVAMLGAIKRAVVVTHGKPDGDAYGSVTALTLTLRKLGCDAVGWFVPPIQECFLSLDGSEVTREFEDQAAAPFFPQSDPSYSNDDLLIIVDTGAWAQVAAMREVIEPHLDRALIIDHHLSGDVIAKHRLIDSKAAATCELLVDVLDALGATRPDLNLLDLAVCEALFLGIASDTGWFRFSNTTAHTHKTAARLVDAGVNSAAVYERFEQNGSTSRIKLLARALSSLTFHADERVAIMTLRAEDFQLAGAQIEETERFIDVPQSIESLELIVFIIEPLRALEREEEQGVIRMSFRSKPGELAVNVAELARQFGGGGHARAAGAKVKGQFTDVVVKVTDAAVASLK